MPGQMSFAEFQQAVSATAPPAGLGPALQALWHDARGDWDAAHRLAQEGDGINGAWVHAYLHRKEGDNANAAYWYRRAGQPMASGELGAEWEQIARALLAG
jgi:hypothetical protein